MNTFCQINQRFFHPEKLSQLFDAFFVNGSSNQTAKSIFPPSAQRPFWNLFYVRVTGEVEKGAGRGIDHRAGKMEIVKL